MRIDALTKASEEIRGYLDLLADRAPRCAMNPDDPSMTVQRARKMLTDAAEALEHAAVVLDGVAVPMATPKATKSKK